jgi:hypothetical protein
MKFIWVTLREFIDNGGKLETGRNIYLSANTNPIGEYKTFEGGLHLITSGLRTHPISETTFFVAIEVQPIWE